MSTASFPRRAAHTETLRAGDHPAAGPAPGTHRRSGGGGHLFVPQRWHRPALLKWLRRTHAWLGVWGAVLGLLFGATGILLNHRATMKIPAAHYAQTQWQLALPHPLPADIAALSRFLQQSLQLDHEPVLQRVEPAAPAPWAGARQPERWQLNFATPRETVNAEYWVGNQSVSVRRMDPNFYARLNRLHMATGASVAWILLTDTLAGGLVALSLTGMLLWTRLHGSRLLALGLAGTCLSLVLLLSLTGL